jgi:hypothetical protein
MRLSDGRGGLPRGYPAAGWFEGAKAYRAVLHGINGLAGRASVETADKEAVAAERHRDFCGAVHLRYMSANITRHAMSPICVDISWGILNYKVQ